TSTLCLIPVWYFALLMVYRRQVSWLSLFYAGCQLTILILAVTVRGTAIWSVLYLFALSSVLGVIRWLKAIPIDRTATALLRQIASWPVVVAVAAVVAHSQYVTAKLHPVYFSDDILPHHPVWHSAYVGLQYSPELYGFAVPQDMLGSDAMGM